MLHEISPSFFNISLDNERELKTEDRVLCFKNNKILLKEEGEHLTIPKRENIKDFIEELDGNYLGDVEGEKYFLATISSGIPEGFVCLSMPQMRPKVNKLTRWIIALGFQIYRWNEDNKFCGRCGNPMEPKDDERAMRCSSCTNLIFPKLSPAVIVAITKGDQILLAKNKLFPGSLYSIIAGYVEAGETIEETLRREVKEEVGVELKSFNYYKSQPWPFSSSIMMGFFAEAHEDAEITIDDDEISDAAWFEAHDLPEIPNEDSVAGEMIRIFKERYR